MASDSCSANWIDCKCVYACTSQNQISCGIKRRRCSGKATVFDREYPDVFATPVDIAIDKDGEK